MRNQYSKEAYAQVYKLYDLVESIKGCRSAVLNRLYSRYNLNFEERQKEQEIRQIKLEEAKQFGGNTNNTILKADN